jgi:hypothetical protein
LARTIASCPWWAALVVACSAAPPAPAQQAEPTSPPVQAVSTVIVANGCANLGHANARVAESAMYKLVEGCSSVPGGSIRFSATLLTTGLIEIKPGEGQPDVLPLCVLKHDLRHKVALTKACVLDIRLEEKTMHTAAAAKTAAN